MKKAFKKFLLLGLVMTLSCSLLMGCGKTTKDDKTDGAASMSTDATGNSSASAADNQKEKITITKLAASSLTLDPIIGGDLNKQPWLMELEKRTGVHIEFIITTAGDADTKASLLIASGDIPDIFTLPTSYTGGAAKAAEDGLIVKISDYWDKYAPNYKKVVNSNTEWAKNIKTDSGDVLSFSAIREDKAITVFFGPMIRKDLLDKAGLAVPETIDEWHTALAAFKSQGVKSPFTALKWFPGYCGAFSGAYGVSNNKDAPAIGLDGKLHYGPIEPGFKEYLTTMNKWFKEGLIDPDFINLNDWGVLDTKIISGESAATLHFLSSVTDYTLKAKDKIAGFNLVATKYPVLNKGDQPLYGQADNPTLSLSVVSAKSKYIERVIEYMDYGYSEEGQMLMNFGIEGESYTLDSSGNPIYTSLITDAKNSKGWTKDQSLLMYCPASSDAAATVQKKSYFDQIRANSDAAREALQLWSAPKLSVTLPNLSYSKAETLVTKNMTNVATYVEEMTAKFITGAEPLANFDKYVEQCKKLGIEDIMSIYNDAYDRFNKR
jgi:ABC-type sugar transport system, periplasmic component